MVLEGSAVSYERGTPVQRDIWLDINWGGVLFLMSEVPLYKETSGWMSTAVSRQQVPLKSLGAGKLIQKCLEGDLRV